MMLRLKISDACARLFLVGMACCLAMACTQPGESSSTADSEPDQVVVAPEGQLTASVIPVAYAVNLSLDAAVPDYAGTVAIEVELQEASESIYLHAKQMQVTRATLEPKHESRQGVALEVALQTDSGILQLDPPAPVSAGFYLLKLEFESRFNESLEGLYRVQEGDEWYAFTQFQAISARLAFPSFDDPQFKTPFSISLTVPANHQAIATTPLKSKQSNDDGSVTWNFRTSEPIPTYLVAFATGPLDVVEWEDLPPTPTRERPVPMRGVAVAGKGGQLDHALAGTQAIFEAMEDYFQISYPYQKLDIIAVPDFSAGAMENVGAITYREQLLLIDENSSRRQKRAYRSVHAHELAHQWFGNLVTPVWWDDIWLNEAFATWMAAVALDEIEPDAGWRLGLTQRSLGAMGTDSLVSARQVRQPIESDDDIANAFDGITYSKGGGVLSMFENFLGREAFRDGVQNHLNRHRHGNATQDDFIDALAEQGGDIPAEQVASAFRDFLRQPGIPMLTFTTECSNDSAAVAVSQSRYLPLGSPGASGESGWQVPVCIGTDQGKQCRILGPEPATLNLGYCPTYLMPNADGAGYYRWSLGSEQGWTDLMDQFPGLEASEQLVTADALSAALSSGELKLADWMAALPAITASDNWRVATGPIGDAGFLLNRVANGNHAVRLKQQFSTVYRPLLDEVGLQRQETDDASSLQSALVAFLALELDDQPLREDLITQVDGALAGNMDDINPNLMGTAFKVAVETKPEQYYPAIRQAGLASDNAILRGWAWSGLGMAESGQWVADARELALSEKLRDNEFYAILFNQLANPTLRQDTWQWTQRNLEAILARIPVWRHGRIAGIGGYFCSADKQTEVESYFRPKVSDLQGGPRALNNTLERIGICAAKKRYLETEIQALELDDQSVAAH